MSSDHPRDLNLNRLRPPNPQAEQFEQPERRQRSRRAARLWAARRAVVSSARVGARPR